jgi:hypothetical protein
VKKYINKRTKEGRRKEIEGTRIEKVFYSLPTDNGLC